VMLLNRWPSSHCAAFLNLSIPSIVIKVIHNILYNYPLVDYRSYGKSPWK
jgi:hypothetical protein